MVSNRVSVSNSVRRGVRVLGLGLVMGSNRVSVSNSVRRGVRVLVEG